MKIVVNTKFCRLTSHIVRLPEIFDEGEPIYMARNVLRRFCWDSVEVVVKKYKIPIFINRLVYSTIRKSKARRGYEYSHRLADRDIRTPEGVAYIEIYSCGVLADSYLVTLYEPYPRLMREFYFDNPAGDEGKKILRAFAAYAVRLHESGILHEDLSPGNIAFQVDGEKVDFSLFDINRMKFGPIAWSKCLRNFCRVTTSPAVLSLIVSEYARLRRWDADSSVKTALRAQRRFFARRK